MVLSKNSAEVLYLKKRKGLVTLAQEAGVPIVPLYAFGTTKHFLRYPDESDGLIARVSRKLKASLLFPVGKCGLPIPRWHKVTIVIGEPIDTSGDVDAVHAQWVAWFEKTYETYKEEAGYAERPLEIL